MQKLNTRSRRPRYPLADQIRPRLAAPRRRRPPVLGHEAFIALCEFVHEASVGPAAQPGERSV